MLYRIIYSDIFFEKLKDISDYYFSFVNESFIENFQEFILGYVENLNFMPQRCKLFDISEGVYIFVIEGKYKIYYKINENKKEVYILKISLSSQNDVNFF